MANVYLQRIPVDKLRYMMRRGRREREGGGASAGLGGERGEGEGERGSGECGVGSGEWGVGRGE